MEGGGEFGHEERKFFPKRLFQLYQCIYLLFSEIKNKKFFSGLLNDPSKQPRVPQYRIITSHLWGAGKSLTPSSWGGKVPDLQCLLISLTMAHLELLQKEQQPAHKIPENWNQLSQVTAGQVQNSSTSKQRWQGERSSIGEATVLPEDLSCVMGQVKQLLGAHEIWKHIQVSCFAGETTQF